MPTLESLFDVTYPKTLVFGHYKSETGPVPFVTSTSRNNGVAGYVAPIKSAKLFKEGAITVPLKGSVMVAHLQPNPFYCAHQIAVLYPKQLMTEQQLLFYVACLRANKYRFNYGRQADRTLRTLEVPAMREAPRWVRSAGPRQFDGLGGSASGSEPPQFVPESWTLFKIGDLFEIKKGKRLVKQHREPGATPFIGAIDRRNGLVSFIRGEPQHTEGTLSVPYNGNGVAAGFFQPTPFIASDDINVLYPKGFTLSPERALFVAAVIRHEKYRFNYGRKWHVDRMRESEIALPAKGGKPDWGYMERFIRALPLSRAATA